MQNISKSLVQNNRESNLAVYTVIIGQDYQLPPISPEPGVEYFCFSDCQDLEAGHWKLVPVRPILPADPVRSSREYKIRAHRYLQDYAGSLYLDSSVELLASPTLIWRQLMGSPDCVFGALFHSFRDTISKEFEAVAKGHLDIPGILSQQYECYRKFYPAVLGQKPVWGGLLARRHNNPDCIDAMEQWFAEVMRYSRRDQLSLPVALSTLALSKLSISNTDIRQSEFHRWPIAGHKRPAKYFEGIKQAESKPAPVLPRRILSRLKRVISHQRDPLSIKQAAKPDTNFDEKHSLFFVEQENDWPRVYVADEKRTSLYSRGIDYRLKRLLRDYRIPQDLIRPTIS